MVLSELRKARPSKQVITWMRAQEPSSIGLSVITLSEVERGIEKVRKTNPEFSNELAAWLEKMVLFYDSSIVPFEASHARLWGKLSAKHGHEGADVLIAASAMCLGLKIATRNIDDFSRLGVDVINPFEYQI
jgi:predicted nucleic acid-binding protein